ncbi:MAG: GPW/gp25 family protein [Moraxellaceae bacterium]|nr:GPW/gp25 family protein [Moraxellaceae bacterium]
MSYPGMHVETGRTIADLQHIRQSVRDILTTRLGTRLMRRDYGSLLPELIDQPLNDATRMRVMAATVAAVIAWEPRIRVTHVGMEVGTGDAAGTLVVTLDGERTDGPRGEAVSLEVPLR